MLGFSNPNNSYAKITREYHKINIEQNFIKVIQNFIYCKSQLTDRVPAQRKKK